MKSVLILCTGNSCRSQMAEAIWNKLGQGHWRALSAGTKPAGYVHPLALVALREYGLEPESLQSKSLDTLAGQAFDLVVTVCDDAREACPYFPGKKVLHWPFYDPARASGTEQEKLNVFRRVRDHIAWRISDYLATETTPIRPEARNLALSLEEHDEIGQLIDVAFSEDLAGGIDATSQAIVPPTLVGTATFLSRQAGVVAGLPICAEIVRRKADQVQWQPLALDGDAVFAGQALGFLKGSAREILKIERICLNFLGRLSGIASATQKFVASVAGTAARICDTRKTTPGWRHLEKHAVRCGGGVNHRMGLFDAILIKDNHLAVLRTQGDSPQVAVERAIQEARHWIQNHQQLLPLGPNTLVQIEVDREEMLRAACHARPDMILLDNMTIESLVEAVAIRDQIAPRILLEASGGITLDSVGDVARTGVERISIGAITHSAANFDIGLDWQIGE